MKILVLIHEFPPVGGGGGRAAQDICVGLVQRGYKVTVITAHLKGLPKEENIEGICVLRLPSLRQEAFRASLVAMGGYILSGLWTGYQLIKTWKPDIIHVHFAVPAGALAWALAKLTGIPYVMTAHLGDVPGGVPEKTGGWFKWILPLTRPIWQDAKQVIAVSEFTRRLALNHYRREIGVIPNGVDLKQLRAKRVKVHKPPRIIFAGRLMEQKNPIQIVSSLAELRDLSWECVLLGDGPMMPDIQKEIINNGLQNRIILTGWVSPEEVLNQFEKSDILFMPSRSEGLPVVGVQALAKGLAFVVSDIGGFVDLVDDGENGFLVALSKPSDFSIALRNILADATRLKSFKEASLKKASQFDIVKITKNYEQIFLEITKPN